MVNLSSSDKLSNSFKFFESLSELYEARFMRPLWERYPTYDTDSYDALAVFLDGYAFARQGAKPDFRHVAVDVVTELKKQGHCLTDEAMPQKAWQMFRNRLQSKDLNEANCPLCPQGTNYVRKAGSSKTSGTSVFEFLSNLEKNNIPPNIILCARYSMQLNKVKDVHDKFCTINGIGTKIASLFLSDVARVYQVFPTKDRALIQPVDVWIKRIISYLLQRDLSVQDVQNVIVEQALGNKLNPEAVTEGIWYFGSEIADSEYRVWKTLDSLPYAEALLKEHVEAIRQEALAWEKRPKIGNG